MCSTICSSETLQNLTYFMYKKTHEVFFVFHFVQLYIFTLWMPLVYVDIYIKYSKFWSVSLEHFVERKPLFSEECDMHFLKIFFRALLEEELAGRRIIITQPLSRLMVDLAHRNEDFSEANLSLSKTWTCFESHR